MIVLKKQVSRAIGDGDYKPLVTAQPDITTIKRNGTEDFLIGAVHNFVFFSSFNYSNVGWLFCTPVPPKFTKKLAVDSFFQLRELI